MNVEHCIVKNIFKMKNVGTNAMTTEEVLELAHDKG